MAAKRRVDEFRSALSFIADHITNGKLDKMKFLCEDNLRPTTLEKVRTAEDLFRELQSAGLLRNGLTEFLEDLLRQCEMEPLIPKLDAFKGKPLVTDSTDSAFFSADHLPFKVPHFCGRNAIVDEIVALVSEQEQHTVVMIAPPGFGKSAVVTHVGHTLLERKLASVLYVSLRQRKSLSEVCSDIARCCGQESTPGGGNDPVLLAQDLLSNLQHRTVLILDNAEDLQDSPDTEKFARFIDYLGSHVKRLCVLLTTRQELVIPYLDIHRIQLPALGPKVAANLLSKLTKNSSARWSELGELCGGVPLYLSIAASQLNNGLNARVLIGQLRKKGLAGVLRSPDSSLEVCYNSLLVFFKQIKKNLLVSLVQLAVFPTSFTVTDVCFLFKERFDCELALSNLVKNALLQRTSDGSSRRYELHPLIQSFCKTERKSLGLESEGNKAEKLFIQHHLKLLQDLHREFVSNDGCQNAMENFYQKKVNILHALKESLETSQPSNKIKQLALDVCTEVVNFLAKALGPADFYDLYDQCQKAADRLSDVVRQSDCQVSLGFHYLLDVNHGKMSKEAEDCFQNAQELRNSIPLTPRRCQEREAYTHGLSKLGLCQVLRGSVEDGRELILKALRKRRERADHLMEAAGYCDLALSYHHEGKHQKAIDLWLRHTLKQYKRRLGSHPWVATTLNFIADAYRARGELDETIKYTKQALATREKLLGKGHLDTTRSLCQLARVYREQGKLEESLKGFQDALHLQRANLGVHQDTVSTMKEVSDLLRQMGRGEDSENMSQQASECHCELRKRLNVQRQTSSEHVQRCFDGLPLCTFWTLCVVFLAVLLYLSLVLVSERGPLNGTVAQGDL